MTVAELRKMQEEYHEKKNGVAVRALEIAVVACGRERGGFSNEEIDSMLRSMVMFAVSFCLHTRLTPEIEASLKRLALIRNTNPEAK